MSRVRRYIITFLMIIFCFVAQTSVFRTLSLNGIKPNLTLVLTVATGLMRGDVAGLVVGFSTGLLVDIFSGDLIGFYAALYMLTGYICGRFHKMYFPENLILPLSTIAIADVAFGVANYVFLFLFRLKFHFFYYLFRVIVPETVYTIVVSLVLYPCVLRINSWLEDLEQRSAKKFV